MNIYSELFDIWKDSGFDSVLFSKRLKKLGWIDINKKFKHGIFKCVFAKDYIVVKFDDEIGGNHTKSEYLSYIRSSEKRRAFIVPCLFYKKGLLFQPLLNDVYTGEMENVSREIQLIAKENKFSHWWNYGYLDGSLKFYDTDSLYYQLTDKEERIK